MIYFHIPFCKQKCSYCNFHFSTSLNQKQDLLLALHKELSLREGELEKKPLSSIYFGGGTPSLLEVDEIWALLEKTQRYFDWQEDIEITLEANPDDLCAAKLQALSKTPINRLSIGTQSFFKDDLILMNRAHTASEAVDSIKRSQDFGFENLSIDLIYGAMTSNMEIWQENLRMAMSLEIPHISAYALTVEPKTTLSHWIQEKIVPPPSQALQNDQFHWMSQFLKTQGLSHYEISNFAVPGKESRHNSSYWNYSPYLGIGPSAHSYDGKSKRSWSVSNNTKYIQSLQKGELPIEEEILKEKDRYNEMLMIGLRTRKGVDLKRLQSEFSSEILAHFQNELTPKIDNGYLKMEGSRLVIPSEHWFMADGIASDLFKI